MIKFILYRYLFLSWACQKKYRQGSAISILIPVLGVAVGVFAFIVVISVMSGFVQEIKANMLRFEPHIVVESLNGQSQISFETVKKFQNLINSHFLTLTGAITKIQPYQTTDVIIQAQDKAIIAKLEGINPDLKNELSLYLNRRSSLQNLNLDMPSIAVENSALFPTVILGQDLLNQLNLQVGDTVTLISTTLDDGFVGISPTQLPVVISGYLRSGNFSFDKKLILSSLKTANKFMETPNSIHGFKLTLKNSMSCDEVSKILNEKLNLIQLKAVSWTENNKSLLLALQIEHYAMVFVLIMIIVVACFSITISLLLSIRRRSKEMAILKSMGFKQIDLSILYLWQGFLIGLSGIVLGLSMGMMALYFIHNYSIPFVTSSYSSKPLPVLLEARDLVIVTLGSLFFSMLAAVWPAIEVRNLDILEIIRK